MAMMIRAPARMISLRSSKATGGSWWKIGGGKSENCHHDIPHNQAVFEGLVEEVEVK